MTTFLWVIVAFIVSVLVARYNQSNKLFWQLFTAFIVGIAGTHIYNKVTTNDESYVDSVVAPSQEFHCTSATAMLPVTEVSNEAESRKLHSVSSDSNITDSDYAELVVSNDRGLVNNPVSAKGYNNHVIKICYTHTSTPVDSIKIYNKSFSAQQTVNQ